MTKLTFIRQRRGTKPIAVDSIARARDAWNTIRERTNAGCSSLGNGGSVLDADGRIVANISYNGRVWNPDGSEMVLP